MLKHLLPKDRILRRALEGLLLFVILSIVAGGLGAWDAYRHGWPARGHEDVAQIAWQFGIDSPEAAAAVKYVGERPSSKELVALLDPITGKAIAAWPSDYAGKAPEEMTLSSGVKLPSLKMMQGRVRFTLRRHANGKTGGLSPYYRDRIMVRLDPLSPGGKVRAELGELNRMMLQPPPGTGAPDAVSALPAGPGREYRHHWHKYEWNSRLVPGAPPIGYLLVVSAHQAFTATGIATRIIGAAGALSFLFYWLSIAWWVFTDARQRGGRAFAWGALVLLTNLVGVTIYLIVRREWRVCSSCGAGVEKNFCHCPFCGHALEIICAKCGRSMCRDWAFCVDCATPRYDANTAE
jgi:hypothetical protein